MILIHLLLSLLLATGASARCSICSLFSDYYDDAPTIRTVEGLHDTERTLPRIYSSNSPGKHELTSLGRFTDITSSLFGNLFNLIGERTARISSEDGSSPLRGGRERLTPIIEKPGTNSKEKVTDQLFNIFDSIGSGIIQMSRLEGPHICTRESTRRWPADGSSLRSEKRCQRFREANKCIDQRTDSKVTVETTRVEECCEGYETKDIFEHGCPIESSLVTVEDALEAANSSLWKHAKIVKLDNELKNNVTIFVTSESDDKVADAKSYVLNRVVPGMYRSYDWTDGTVLKTIGDGELVVSQFENPFGSVKTYVNCVPLDSTSVRTQSGIVHFVSADLAPAAETVLSVLESDPRFALFLSVLSEDLRELLSSNESFTVLAPSEKVLSSLSESLMEDIKKGRGCASDFARSHIVNGSFCSSQLLIRQLNTLAGGQIDSRAQIKNGEREIHIGRARLLGKEVFAKNGVVHEIDDILFSDELLSWREHLEIYNHELAKSIEEVMKNSSAPVTIFVPPSENETLSEEMGKNHIVIGDVLENFQLPSTLTTEAGSVMFTGYSRPTSPIWMRISMQPQRRQRGQIACSRITQESVKGCRAILQFIDKPLPITHDNFETFLARRSDLSKFYRLWRESSLNTSMTDDKLLTAFVPSDDAFSSNDFKKLTSDRKLAEIFVRRHVIEEPLCNFNLRHHPGEIRIQTYANLNGEALKPTQIDGEIFIDGARVEESEILLTNGVVYVVDSIIARNYAVTQPAANRRKAANLLDIIS